eukprot:57252-Prorocentrum_minimum.AAC.1
MVLLARVRRAFLQRKRAWAAAEIVRNAARVRSHALALQARCGARPGGDAAPPPPLRAAATASDAGPIPLEIRGKKPQVRAVPLV